MKLWLPIAVTLFTVAIATAREPYRTTRERPVKFTGEQEARMRRVRAFMDSVVFPKVSLSGVSHREAFDWVQKNIPLHAPSATPGNERGMSMVLRFRWDKPERVNVSLSAATLPQVLDAICAQHDYVWILESTALSVIPREDLSK